MMMDIISVSELIEKMIRFLSGNLRDINHFMAVWSVDLKEKGLSKGEFNSVLQAVGGLDALIDPECKDKDLLALITYTSESSRAQKVLENQSVIRQPIVRNGKQSTVGYAPEIWKTWQ